MECTENPKKLPLKYTRIVGFTDYPLGQPKNVQR